MLLTTKTAKCVWKKDNVSRETMKFVKPGKRKTAGNTKKKLNLVLHCTFHTKNSGFLSFLRENHPKSAINGRKSKFFLRRGAKKHGKTTDFSPESLISDAIFAFFFLGKTMLWILHQEQKAKKAEPLTKKEPFRQEFAPKNCRQTKNTAKLLQKPRFLLFFRQFFAENVCFFQKRENKGVGKRNFRQLFCKIRLFCCGFFEKTSFFCFLACFFVLCCVLFLFRNLRKFCLFFARFCNFRGFSVIFYCFFFVVFLLRLFCDGVFTKFCIFFSKFLINYLVF